MNTIFGQKYAKQTTSTLRGLFIMTGLVLMPFNAAAQMPSATPDQSVSLGAPVNIINDTVKNSPSNDVPMPSYGFSDTGTIVASTPTVTDIGIWEYKKKTLTSHTVANRGPIVLPTSTAPLVMQGEASYYSRAGCLGCNQLFVMANGQVLDDNALTMAIGADKVYLVGHIARVTNVANGKSVNVRITDTGGFYQAKYGNRVADLTIGTKQAIGMNGGVGQVKVEVF